MLAALKKKFRERLRRLITPLVNEILQEDLGRHLQIARQMEEFRSAPASMLASAVEAQTTIPGLLRQIGAQAIPLREERIDAGDFATWRREHPALDRLYAGKGDTAVEKVLEHYLSMKFLPIAAGDVVIDMAAAGSLFADMLAKQSGQACYKLDLAYPAGISANRIGADVTGTGLPDCFADVLTFHCAFECLQGDADIRFAAEAERILKPGGRWGIVPLYLDHRHFVKLGPQSDRRGVKLAEDEAWVWRDDAFPAAPFSRHYSAESLVRRVLSRCSGFEAEIIHFNNVGELRRAYPGQRLYCHFMFRARKK